MLTYVIYSSPWDEDCIHCATDFLEDLQDPTSRQPMTDWRVSFEVWDLSTKKSKFKLYADISRHDGSSYFQCCKSGHYLPRTNLRIPLAISRDLRKVQVIHDFITIKAADPSIRTANTRGCHFDQICIDPWPIAVDGTSMSNRTSSIRGVLFDPYGRYLLFTHLYFGLCIVEFSDTDGLPKILAKTHDVGILENISLSLSNMACFHPFLPCLAVSGELGIVLWSFSNPGM